MPEISGLALEADQGVIRWPAPFGGCSLAVLSPDARRGSAPATVIAPLLRSLLVAIAVCFIHLAPVTLLVTREIWRDGTRYSVEGYPPSGGWPVVLSF